MNLLPGLILSFGIPVVIGLIVWLWPTGRQEKMKFYTIDANGKVKRIKVRRRAR